MDGSQGDWAGVMITLVLEVAQSKEETQSYSREYLAGARLIVVARWGVGLEETGAFFRGQSC